MLDESWARMFLCKAKAKVAKICKDYKLYHQNPAYNARLAKTRIEQQELICFHYCWRLAKSLQAQVAAHKQLVVEPGPAKTAGAMESGSAKDAEPGFSGAANADNNAASNGKIDEAKQPA